MDELEKLAELEHEQWMKWAKSLMKDEDLSPERIARWKKLFIDYNKLSDEDKKDDRVWARKAIKITDELDEAFIGYLQDRPVIESYAANLIEMTKRQLLQEIVK